MSVDKRNLLATRCATSFSTLQRCARPATATSPALDKATCISASVQLTHCAMKEFCGGQLGSWTRCRHDADPAACGGKMEAVRSCMKANGLPDPGVPFFNKLRKVSE
eukprot:TRINITY_DN7103_c0_g1_i1.p1 TRINITY_DN7103_c0_g1~~TRINITY_DN7103_c0_g1_i1.p1  ORF type:complete len:107 (-),score=9.29 TRINITY_DN7103_c0_g1_i1:209-529(-)